MKPIRFQNGQVKFEQKRKDKSATEKESLLWDEEEFSERNE